MPTKRILTGIQSTGIPHIGNLFGSILPSIQLANHNPHSGFFFIADLHALTAQPDIGKVNYFTQATAAAWLACGLDVSKNLLYRQSRIPAVCELAWFLNCLTPYPMLANAHAFKSKAQNLAQVNAGLFTYPVLMAADILLYQATHIPVGHDQRQHLEIARDLASLFNRKYQPVFVQPEAIYSLQNAVVPGIDGRKMSKSYGNTIDIFAPEKDLYEAIMRIQTDSIPLASPKDPNHCTVFCLYKLIASKEQSLAMHKRYLAGGYGYGEAKKELVKVILQVFKKPRAMFMYYMNNPEKLEQKLLLGEEKARRIAQNTIKIVKKAIGIMG